MVDQSVGRGGSKTTSFLGSATNWIWVGEILEIGPGPGLTTDWLQRYYKDITCLEVDPVLARSLRKRIANANVNVQLGDATGMPFPEARFSADP